MYINPLFSKSELSHAPSLSTVATPVSEEDLAAARMVLRSVIPSFKPPSTASVPPPPVILFESKETQTDSHMEKVSLEGLVRAAGMSLLNFSQEVKLLERRIESQQSELVSAIKDLKRDFIN